MRDIEPDENLSEPGRYNSAENWDPYKKQRKAAAKLTRDFLAEPPNPFRQLNGDELAKTPAPIKEPKQLFGNLWREGEVAILFGETATGKSILATQIAESIARGIVGPQASRLPVSRVRSPHVSKGSRRNSPPWLGGVDAASADGVIARAQPVLYFDFERTLAQFQERYSIRRSPTSDRRIKYKFFRNFNRLDLTHIDDAANDIKGDLNLFCRNAVRRQIEQSPARVIIIDNISYLSRATSNSAGASLIKTLKLWANLYNVSILAVAHIKDRRRKGAGFSSPPGLRRGDDASSAGWFSGVGKPITLADLPPYASLADTVFAIAPSSMAPDIRYIKHLKSSFQSSPPELGGVAAASADGVVVLRLERLSEPGAIATGLLSSPPELGGVAAASADGVVVSSSTIKISQLSTINSQLNEAPFIGFTHLGHAAEAEHLRDYEREARDAHNREQKRLREWHRSSKEALIQGYFDGSYARYLKGE